MHSQEIHEFNMENTIEIFSNRAEQLNISSTGANAMDEVEIFASMTDPTNNFIHLPEPSSEHNSTRAGSSDGDRVCASTSDSTNVQSENRNESIQKINRELLMSVIDDLTSKQQKLQGSESAMLSRIIFLDNELKDTQLKHIICAKKLAKAQQELEDAEKKIKQKDLALTELRDKCNALNTSVHRSNEAVELAFLECGESHNTQSLLNKERYDALQEMQRIKNDHNEKLSKMKCTMDSYKQKVKHVMKLMQQQVNSLNQLDFDAI